MTLPNFFIVGAAKSGTTSLAAYLRQHPDVYFSPRKEPNYFAFYGEEPSAAGPAPEAVVRKLYLSHTVNDFDAYRALFAAANGESALGDASVRYLYEPRAAERIRAHAPNARIVIVLREPARRAYSHYTMNRQHQLETLSFDGALEAEADRRAAGWGYDWHYVGVSRYAEQVKRYLDQFGEDAVKTILFEDFADDPASVYRDVCTHIGVDPSFAPDFSVREKVTVWPKNAALDRWLNWPNPMREALERGPTRRVARRLFNAVRAKNAVPPPKLSPDTHARLKETFKDDVAELSVLLGRPTGWN
ncbi:MAG: sulfotransferase [Pseudomonadota bacterium]